MCRVKVLGRAGGGTKKAVATFSVVTYPAVVLATAKQTVAANNAPASHSLEPSCNFCTTVERTRTPTPSRAPRTAVQQGEGGAVGVHRRGHPGRPATAGAVEGRGSGLGNPLRGGVGRAPHQEAGPRLRAGIGRGGAAGERGDPDLIEAHGVQHHHFPDKAEGACNCLCNCLCNCFVYLRVWFGCVCLFVCMFVCRSIEAQWAALYFLLVPVFGFWSQIGRVLGVWSMRCGMG